MQIKIFLASFLILIFSITTTAQELSGFIATESRLFPESPLDDKQFETYNLSFSFKPELYYEWDNGDHSLLFVPFLRWDLNDEERTHFDIRELFWLYYSNEYELRIGIRKVFWGVTESSHLVDVINQTDFVEDIDGEQKLGQPMVNFAYIQDWGTLDLFVLPYFRERTFAGEEGRFRFPLLVDTDNPLFEAGNEKNHIDFAIRYSNTFGDFDVGLSHFVGTSREPRFVPDFHSPIPRLFPYYDLMNQTGIDIQYTTGGWLWKFEGITRHSRAQRFFAFTGGFEYTFPDINSSGIDVGVIAEYLYDDRDQINLPPNPFDNHIFIGSRLAFNDVQSTDLLVGGNVNLDTGSMFLNLEGSRRIGDSFKLNVRIRGFANIEEEELFYGFRKDSYSQVEIEWYF